MKTEKNCSGNMINNNTEDNYKSIGILSLANAENYGAILQSFSLCKYLNEKYTYAEIIDFTPKFFIGRYKWFRINGKTVWARIKSGCRSIRLAPILLLKKYRFKSFKNKYCNFSKNKYVKTITEDKYVKYIVGSDQVWNLELTGFEEEFFLPNIADRRKKYSYAASIGVSNLDEKMKNVFSKYLPTFNKISVRERTGKMLLEETVSDICIENHIDPVFLHNAKDWAQYSRKRLLKEKYVLIYSFTNFRAALEIARKTGYKIYSIHNSYRGTLKDVRSLPGVGPREFLSLIRNAEYIVTDSFHGTAFSIIFNKKFNVIPYKGTATRMEDMLENIGLSDRLYRDDNEIDTDSQIDYSAVNEKLQELIDKADSYLKSIVTE